MEQSLSTSHRAAAVRRWADLAAENAELPGAPDKAWHAISAALRRCAQQYEEGDTDAADRHLDLISRAILATPPTPAERAELVARAELAAQARRAARSASVLLADPDALPGGAWGRVDCAAVTLAEVADDLAAMATARELWCEW